MKTITNLIKSFFESLCYGMAESRVRRADFYINFYSHVRKE